MASAMRWELVKKRGRLTAPRGEWNEAADEHAESESAAAGDESADFGAGEDVHGPEESGDEDEGDSDGV